MLTLFSATFVCWGWAAMDVRLNDNEELPLADWSMYDPRLISDIFYGMAEMMAIGRVLFYLQISSSIGPLQVGRDVHETVIAETETRPRRWPFCPR